MRSRNGPSFPFCVSVDRLDRGVRPDPSTRRPRWAGKAAAMAANPIDGIWVLVPGTSRGRSTVWPENVRSLGRPAGGGALAFDQNP